MPFKPGQSGNPGGGRQPKKDQKKRLISDLLGPHAPRAAEEVAGQLSSEDPKDRQWAANMVIQYVFGKPSQAIEVGANEALSKIILQLVK